MGELQLLQQSFMGWLLHRDEQLKSLVIGSEKVSIDTRLGIYANAYRLRLLEALQDTFPALHTLLGDEDERFEKLSYAYIDQHPSHHFSIRYFGHQLSDYLRGATAYADQPVLAEMAAFEWTLRDAFDAADVSAKTEEALKKVPPEQWSGMQLQFHPSVRRLDLQWNVPALWQAIDKEEAPIPAEKNEYPIAWLIWRKDLRTYYRSLDVDEAWALDAVLEHNKSFADLCAGLTEWIDAMNVAARVANLISNWVEDKLIVGIGLAE